MSCADLSEDVTRQIKSTLDRGITDCLERLDALAYGRRDISHEDIEAFLNYWGYSDILDAWVNWMAEADND